MDLHSFTWIYMDLHGFTLIHIDFHKDLHGFFHWFIMFFVDLGRFWGVAGLEGLAPCGSLRDGDPTPYICSMLSSWRLPGEHKLKNK